MTRLFVALDLPTEKKTALMRLQPKSVPGIRTTPSEQLHLTLHFLGEMDLDPVREALASVRAPAFSLTVQGVGTFGSPRRGIIFWVGLSDCPELQQLHAAIAEALLPTGYLPENRPYSPHLTLARSQPHPPRRVIEDFLRQHHDFSLPPFPVTGFALFSSVLNSQGALHTREAEFPLAYS